MIYYQIYNTVNKINSKNYIGLHKCESKEKDDYIGSGELLYRAIEKYGIDNFEKTILEVCETLEQVSFLEKLYIKFYRLSGKCKYNIHDGGFGGWDYVNKNGLNRYKSDDARKNMSKARKGKEPWNKGKSGIYSEETLHKIRMANTGKKQSEETKEKRRMLMQGNKYNLGKTRSEEDKRKRSESRKGKHLYNNGIINVLAYQCPEGFIKGKLKKTK